MKRLLEILEISKITASHTEKVVSAVGSFVAILGIMLVSYNFVDGDSVAIIVTSMGASAVLLFAVPHGTMSQPWPVFGGHIVSAFIGVTCAAYITNELLAASLAVGLAVGAMYYFHCIHPPGGATALSAVIGGDMVHSLGYEFVVTPILLNVVIILFVAVLFNYVFDWRRYPAVLHKRMKNNEVNLGQIPSDISHEDFVYALSQIDSFVDISEHDLLRVYDLAIKRSKRSGLDTKQIIVGAYYSNGEYGDDWAVRQIVKETVVSEDNEAAIDYKVVAGKGRRSTGSSKRDDFLQWCKYQVARDEENWKRVDDSV